MINIYNNSYSFPPKIRNSFMYDIGKYELFLNKLLFDQHLFVEKWLDPKRQSISEKYIRKDIDFDCKWGLYFPFFTLLERYVNAISKPIIIGFSGLPGSGKSTLGYWINKLSSELDLKIKVISLDDFYLPALEMDIAMKGNPWNVPRGLPGSHSIDFINNTLGSYLETGTLKCPIFDKSLRNGLGDRSGWSELCPKVLILEGWFVGCEALNDRTNLNKISNNHNNLSLNLFECEYRNIIQDRLKGYNEIWKMFYKIWHLKSTNIGNTINWKTQQENEMFKLKGSALTGDKLSNFIRMIQASIPHESLSNINADSVVSIDSNRGICNHFSKSYN